MRTPTTDRVAEALFGKTKRNVLALLFGRPDSAFYLREIARETGAGTGAVQRELALLARAGLIRRIRQGQHVYFRADPNSPVFDEMRSLLAKTAGIADVLREGLAESATRQRIRVAFIYGSVAAGSQTSASDIDIMIVGSLELAELMPVLRRLQDRLGREINPTIYRPADLKGAVSDRRPFVRRVLERPRIMLVGSEHDLTKLVGQPVAGRARHEP